MARNWHTRVTIPHGNGVPKDAAILTMAFVNQDEDSTYAVTADALRSAFEAFYNSDIFGVVNVPLAEYMSGVYDHTRMQLDLWDLGTTSVTPAGPLGSPVASRPLTINDFGDNAPLASELAVVATLLTLGRDDAPVEAPDDGDADTGVERPMSRLTGRVYIGPLDSAAASAGANDDSRPSTGVRNAILGAFVSMNVFLLQHVGTDLHPAVWSRANRSLELVDRVRVDDAWDVQRRRGVAPTTNQVSELDITGQP